MNCPKCDAVVDPAAAECPHCGVILSKAHSETTRPRHVPSSAVPADRRQPRRWPIIAALAAVFALAYAVRHRPASGGSAAPSGWYADAGGYKRALAEQADTSKPVLVYFHTDWCGWCRKLDDDVFRSAEFKSRYPAVIKVKVNAEKSGAERTLASDFGVRGFPTVVVIRSGKYGEPIVGYAPPDDYMARLDSLVR